MAKHTIAQIVWLALACIGLFFLLLLYFLPHQGCETTECFLEKADPCGTASVTVTDGPATIQVDAQDCVLRKQITALEGESPDVEGIYTNQPMWCSYEKGQLDPTMVTSLTADITSCSGPLKDRIYETVLTVNGR